MDQGSGELLGNDDSLLGRSQTFQVKDIAEVGSVRDVPPTLHAAVDFILNEAGVFTAPAIQAPSGGVSGRRTLAVATWLIAWAILHRPWKGR